jgi:hypothetical protein
MTMTIHLVSGKLKKKNSTVVKQITMHYYNTTQFFCHLNLNFGFWARDGINTREGYLALVGTLILLGYFALSHSTPITYFFIN